MFSQQKRITRSFIILWIGGLWIFLLVSVHLAEAKDPDYPTKPVTFIIPYAAGGMTDVVVRPLLEAASKYLGQTIVPINKPGGGSTVGVVGVMNSKPDGYTIGHFGGSAVTVSPHYEDCPYRDLGGFTFIMNYGESVWPLIARTDAPYSTWNEFMAWAKRNPPGAIQMGIVSARGRGPSSLAMYQLEKREQIQITYLVQGGASESLTKILGGHINLETSMTPQHLQYIETGKLRILAYMNETKVPGYENYPSFEKLYGILAKGYMGVLGPKGLPNYVLEKLDDAFAKAVKDPGFVDIMNRNGNGVRYLNRAQIDKEVKELFQTYGDLIKALTAEEKEKKN